VGYWQQMNKLINFFLIFSTLVIFLLEIFPFPVEVFLDLLIEQFLCFDEDDPIM